MRENGYVFTANTLPGFLNCTRLGTLPGCLFKYDDPNKQCAAGREGKCATSSLVYYMPQFICVNYTGKLCGDCLPGYGSTFDLRYCRSDCGAGGIVLFLVICIVTLILSLAVLYYDFPLPNELKGVIFFAQVCHVTSSHDLQLYPPCVMLGHWSDLSQHTLHHPERELRCFCSLS